MLRYRRTDSAGSGLRNGAWGWTEMARKQELPGRLGAARLASGSPGSSRKSRHGRYV